MLELLPFALGIQKVNARHNQTERGHRDQKRTVLERQLYGIQAECADIEPLKYVIIKIVGSNLDPNQR